MQLGSTQQQTTKKIKIKYQQQQQQHCHPLERISNLRLSTTKRSSTRGFATFLARPYWFLHPSTFIQYILHLRITIHIHTLIHSSTSQSRFIRYTSIISIFIRSVFIRSCNHPFSLFSFSIHHIDVIRWREHSSICFRSCRFSSISTFVEMIIAFTWWVSKFIRLKFVIHIHLWLKSRWCHLQNWIVVGTGSDFRPSGFLPFSLFLTLFLVFDFSIRWMKYVVGGYFVDGA